VSPIVDGREASGDPSLLSLLLVAASYDLAAKLSLEDHAHANVT